MVIVSYDPHFKKVIHKLKDNLLKEKIKKHIMKITAEPEIGKPMRFSRKGTREVYISPYRLSYMFIPSENKIILLELYHKDEQ
ncbi:MAG: type II toxin-antitoxin system RelE/ParE family toxin [Candidatus Woesearchaeota archaeon]